MMIAQAEVTSPAAPSAFFDRWADMATWPAWNTDTDWVRLDGPFVPGATGVLKPKGGPKVRFVVAALVPDREFTDVSTLFGARLTFRHLVERTPDGTHVAVTVDLTGPLARLWNLVLGKGIKDSLQADLDRLATVVAAPGTASATPATAPASAVPDGASTQDADGAPRADRGADLARRGAA